jgi:queuine tRNA-ribosyltransferase
MGWSRISCPYAAQILVIDHSSNRALPVAQLHAALNGWVPDGRHGLAFTRFGAVNLKNARHAGDPRPLDPESSCAAARDYSRAYLHHLLKANEILAAMVISAVNLAYYQELMADMRAAIAAERFADFREAAREAWARGDLPPLT